MNQAGQANGQPAAPRTPEAPGSRLDDGGYVMVAMLVAIAISAVWMAAALPSWRQQAMREKEAELIYRGEAIARAIYLYRQKNGQALPPNLDVLVTQRFLRKKYKDPITDKDFVIVGGATAAPGGQQGGSAAVQGGVIGVRSSSNEESIRIYNNQQTYSQWAFDFTVEQMRAGGGIPTGVVGPGPGGGRGGRGGFEGRGGGFDTGGQRGRGGVGPTLPGAGRGRQGQGEAPPIPPTRGGAGPTPPGR